MAKLGQVKNVKTEKEKAKKSGENFVEERPKEKTDLLAQTINNLMDDIEVDLGLSQVDVKANRFTTSTGLLSLDLILSGGMVTGGWYTMFGGEQSSKCVAGESLVPTSQGLLRIDDIFESALAVSDDLEFDRFYAVHGDLNVIDHESNLTPVSHVVCNIGYTYAVKTQFGDRLVGLPDHKVQVYTHDGIQWLRLDQLSPRMVVPKRIGQQLYAVTAPAIRVCPASTLFMPKFMSEDLAELFGWLTAKPRAVFDSKTHNKAQVARLQTLVAEIFGENCTVLPSQNLALPKAVAQFVRMHVQGTAVPELVRKSPKDIQQAFLRALFDANGKIENVFAPSKGLFGKGKLEGTCIQLASFHSDLIYGVKALLENMGILCHVKEGQVRQGQAPWFDDKYVLTIHPEFVRDFMQTIGFLTQNKKREQKLAILVQTSPKYGIKMDLMPGLSLVRQLVEDKTLPQEVQDKLYQSFSAYNPYPAGHKTTDALLPKAVVASILYELEVQASNGLDLPDTVQDLVDRIKKLSSYYWTRVVESKKTNKKELVYDLSVPGPHSYQVNGFIGHNSTLVMNQMARSIEMPIPYLIYADFEGCVVLDTKIRVGESYTELCKLIPSQLLANPPERNAFVATEHALKVDTVGGEAPANLFYGGFRSITKITTDSGKTLEGSQHPILVLNETGGADWKLIEDLKIGDTVLEDPGFTD